MPRRRQGNASPILPPYGNRHLTLFMFVYLVYVHEHVRTQLEDVKRGYLLKLRAGVPTPSSLHLPTAPLAAAVESGDFKHASDTLLEGKGGSGEWTRKYFMLDGGKLTFHASHSSTLVVQGSFKLPPTTQVIFLVNP